MWRAACAVGVLAAHFGGTAAPRVAEVLTTAAVVQPANVLDSFLPPMLLTTASGTGRTLKIIAPVAPAPQAPGEALATSGVTQSIAAAGIAAAAAAPVSVGAALAATGAAATGSSSLLTGTITATLQVMPAAVGASPEAPGVMRFIVAFN